MSKRKFPFSDFFGNRSKVPRNEPNYFDTLPNELLDHTCRQMDNPTLRRFINSSSRFRGPCLPILQRRASDLSRYISSHSYDDIAKLIISYEFLENTKKEPGDLSLLFTNPRELYRYLRRTSKDYLSKYMWEKTIPPNYNHLFMDEVFEFTTSGNTVHAPGMNLRNPLGYTRQYEYLSTG